MPDEFLITVAVGIGLLLILLVITNLVFVKPPEKELVTVSSVIELGGFKATYVKGTKIHELGSKEVSNGIFFGESKIKYYFEAPEIESAVIKFRVTRTNNLAPLSVRVNNKLVEQRLYAVGDYTVNVPKELLNESMTVELAAQSSLWQIWAPNIYNLRDVEITVKAFSFEPAEFQLDLAEEFITFKEARIEFSLEENVGRVAVVVNDKEIFNDFVRNEQSIALTKEQLKVGTNKIKIVPALGSRFLGIARAVVFYEVER